MKPQMTCILNNRIWWESSLVVCAVGLVGVLLRCVRFNGRRHFFKVISTEKCVFCVLSSRTRAKSSKANESVVFWKTKNVQHFLAKRQYNPNTA